MTLSEQEKLIFNAMNEGVLIIDTDGIIVFANLAYRRFLNREAGGGDVGDVAGYPLRLLRPGARLPDVLLSRKPILQEVRREETDPYFVNMYPIFDSDGYTLLGGLSVVTFLEEASAFRSKIDEIQRRGRQMLHRISRASWTFQDIVARGELSAQSKRFAELVAASDAPVLLTGESGVGKDVYGQAIHNASPRSGGVFTAINCATFNPETLDSELFGYVGGAFPGASPEGKVGLFEAAAHGTLLLDGISELRSDIQSKLLRALQEHKIRPVGAIEEVPVDVRIIAVSSEDLSRAIAEHRFRADLYYRLNTFHIHIPALRERREDIAILARLFVSELSAAQKRPLRLSDGALERLQRHNWPGNIRELRNVLEFAAYLSTDGVIRAENLPPRVGDAAGRETLSLHERVRRFELDEIKKALEFHGTDLNGKRAAAEELGISLAGLYSKLKAEREDN